MLQHVRRWITYPLVWLLAMLVPMIWTLISDALGPTAAVNQFRIESFDGSYAARPVGQRLELQVRERITAYFPRPSTNRGIERRLDASYGDTAIDLHTFEVTDTEGRELPFRTRTADDGDVILRIGDPDRYVHGTVTYLISYTIGNAMVEADDRQEIYLDINGTGWLQPFDEVTATVDVSRLAGKLLGEQACYQGTAGSTTRCRIEQRGASFHAATSNLAPRETMTIAIGFQPGTVATAVPQPAPVGFGWAGVVAMPAFGVLCLAFALGMRALRRHIGHARQAVTRFEPPPGIPPIAAADLLGRPETGAAAQLADLVVTGLATIATEGEPVATAAQDRGRLGRGPAADLRSRLTVALHRRKKIQNGTLRAICIDLFGDGKPVSLDAVRRGDVADATRLRRELLEQLGVRGRVRAPGPMLAIGMVALVGWGWVQLGFGIPGLAWPFLGLGLLGVLLLVAAIHYYPTVGRLTGAGRLVRDHLAGLHRFITMAEAGRISWLQNAVDAPRVSGPEDSRTLVKLYEPLLPYAIIFGVERTWQQLLGSLHQPVGEEPDAAAAIRPAAWAALAGKSQLPRLYDAHEDRTTSWWDSRPVWGEGWVASARDAIARSWDEWRASRDDDSGGSSWSSGGSSSWSSSDSSSGSSGGGSAGGGMGGGGGGGW